MSNLFDKRNIHLAEGYTIAGRSFKHLHDRIDSLLMVLKSCKGKTCQIPWGVPHPDETVGCLKDALRSKFDTFYKAQPRVSFSSCQLGYIKDEEGPQNLNVLLRRRYWARYRYADAVFS